MITAIARKVASMAHMASLGMVWYRQVCGAMKCTKAYVILSVIRLVINEDLAKRIVSEFVTETRNTQEG